MASITLVQRNKSKGIKTWYARVPDSKGVRFFSLGTTNKTEAKEIMLERLKAGDFERKDDESDMTLGEAALSFEKHHRNKGTKPKTIDNVLDALKSISSLYGKKIVDITNKELSDAFIQYNESVNPNTYRSRKTIVSTLFNYIVDVLEVLPANPVKKAIPNRKAVKPERYFWTAEQIDRILNEAISAPCRLMYAFMAFAGLRISEAKAMTRDKIYDGLIHVKGKGDKYATIPVSPRLQREIDRCKEAWVFRYEKKTLRNACKRAIPEGFPGVAHAHRFRHSFGSILIRNGVNIKVVQTLMRHENITLTLNIYGHILDSDPMEAMEKVFK